MTNDQGSAPDRSLEERAEQRVADYLERREEGVAVEFHSYLEQEVPAEEQATARRIYEDVRKVLGALAPAPVEIEQEWRYATLDPLGRGGNGEVFAVFDRQMERDLAMKLVRDPEGSGTADRRRRARFIAEAKLAGRLEHPGILAVHDLGRTPDGQDYFTMPKLEGQTLLELIRNLHAGEPSRRTAKSLRAGATWSLPRLLDVLVRVAEAVAFAHSRGVVHRDIKPANIMVGRFGETYLLDWGLAVELSNTGRDPAAEPHPARTARAGSLADAALTADGDVVGTPAYMAPEQALCGAREVDQRADVYALGACLHEVLVGAPPYGRDLDSLATLQLLLAGPPTELARSQSELPAELIAVLQRALARDPDERYPSAEDFAADLRAFSEGRVVRAYESGGLAELRKWIGRNRGLSAAMVAALLALVGGVIAALLIRTGERARSLRFLDLQLVQEARAAVDDLWAPGADRELRLQQWLEGSEALSARLPLHREELAILDARATAAAEQRSARGSWTFANRDLRWRHENLSELVRELEQFTGEGGSRDVVGRGLHRLRETWPASREAHSDSWLAAQAAVARSEVYGDFELPVLDGLAPLGLTPAGLLEFAVVGSGERPEAGALPQDSDAIVLVLVPGGVTQVGVADPDSAQATDFDLRARDVRLDPFLLGKQEVSRAQWDRLVHVPQSSRNPGLPRTEVSAAEAQAVLRRWDLLLPNECQWERAAELSLAEVPAETLGSVAWAQAQLGPLRSAADAPPDSLGLHNLLGNVAELCADPLVLDPEFEDGSGTVLEVPGATFPSRCVIKGGYDRLSSLDGSEGLLSFVRPEMRLTARRDEFHERHGIRVCRRLSSGD